MPKIIANTGSHKVAIEEFFNGERAFEKLLSTKEQVFQ